MQIGTLFGIDIVVNKFCILTLPALIFLGIWSRMPVVYGVILVHELAHCAAARALHVQVNCLEILPFGCAARIEETLELRPLSEAAIALSGPLSNILMALCAVFLRYYVNLEWDAVPFVQLNLLLGGFNLLPALPMDGGRCLRALLCRRFGIKRAMGAVLIITRLLAAAALGGGIYWLTRGSIVPNLFMIAALLLVYSLRGAREKAYLQLRSITSGGDVLRRSGAMGVRQLAVREDVTIGSLIDRMIPGRYHVVTVLDKSFVKCGQLEEGQIMDGYVKYGAHADIRRILA